MFRDQEREGVARSVARRIRAEIGGKDSWRDTLAETAVVLGSGWGGRLLPDAKPLFLKGFPEFEQLGVLEGHARAVRYGLVNSRPVLVLDGRVHLNEAPTSKALNDMVRLQVEMLFHLGVKRLILTCAAGSLSWDIQVGHIVIVDGFFSLFAPDMPLYQGEFCCPEDTLAMDLRGVANLASEGLFPFHFGGHVMVRGPQFEGRAYDKSYLAKTGCSVVGMSLLPEACIASLYGVQVLGLCFITNSATEEHSHEANIARVQAKSAELGTYLERIITDLP